MIRNNSLGVFIILMLSLSLVSKGQTNKTYNRPLATLYGTISPHTDIQQWFASMKRWGVEQYYLYSPHYRGYQYSINSPVQMSKNAHYQSVGLLSDMYPIYNDYIETHQIAEQERVINNVSLECKKNNIEMGYMIPFPLFPVQSLDIVKKVQPEFVRSDGRLNIYSDKMPVLLKDVIRQLHKKLPHVLSISIWLAEGSGEIYKFQHDDLVNNQLWLRPVLKAFDEVCAELGLTGIIFSHDYFHTVKTRSQAYQVCAEFPRLILMEDITWPEENTFMPFFNQLTTTDKETLKHIRTMGNYLVDTEYLGQGNWPVPFVRWWQYTAKAGYQNHCEIISGRTFFWDNAKSDQNFNRLNTQLLMLFAKNPDADAKEMLAVAAKDAFGENIPQRLIDIMWESEPMVKNIISINKISVLSHSNFPKAAYLDKSYFNTPYQMKAIDDLFSISGSKLYPELSDTLTATMYWRYVLRTEAQPADVYLRQIDSTITWLSNVIPEVKIISNSLIPVHQKLFCEGFDQLQLIAMGTRCFVEAAKIHHDWYRKKIISNEQACNLMKPIAERLRIIAETDTGYTLEYKKDILNFASQIETLSINRY